MAGEIFIARQDTLENVQGNASIKGTRDDNRDTVTAHIFEFI